MRIFLNYLFSFGNNMNSTDYISISQASELWCLSKRRVAVLCNEGRIDGAKRVGNQWIIPSNATKPKDARFKKIQKVPSAHIKRLHIKKSIIDLYNSIKYEGESNENAKAIALCLFSASVLESQTSISSNIREICSKLAPLFQIDYEKCLKYAEYCPNCSEYTDCSNILAWAYQYLNKITDTTGLCDTQFFTEDYMVSRLVQECNLSPDSVVLDPACGGGNFLTFSLNEIVKKYEIVNQRKVTYSDTQTILNHLTGYDVDRTSAIIADINLRLTALQILNERGLTVSIGNWDDIEPNVYYPLNETIGGYLDIGHFIQPVVKTSNQSNTTLSAICSNYTHVLTNPPFKTIKGMDGRLKSFLKMNYSSCGCDLCNAFIQAILQSSPKNAKIGMVSQNSWMFLKSFKNFRSNILTLSRIKMIINLGSGAFDDISGEKASVSLIIFSKEETVPTVIQDLSSIEKSEKIQSILNRTGPFIEIPVADLLDCQGAIRFRRSFVERLDISIAHYGDFAIPMQGTSTGKSSDVVDWFWKHIGDDEWKGVSKGGGYSRWCGLNNYSIKWVNKGQNIREIPGSALRNVSYFGSTQLCFSDTGTAGLSVRIMRPNEIFIASGPGIRLNSGNVFCHLAFLNSRFATYYLKMTNPKLTIAAGYISMIPVTKDILESVELEKITKQIIELKEKHLSKRPTNREFVWKVESIDSYLLAKHMMMDDFQNEYNRMMLYEELNNIIEKMLDISDAESNEIRVYLNKSIHDSDVSIDIVDLDRLLYKITDENCELNKSKTSKSAMGSDGLLEYVSEYLNVSPKSILDLLCSNIDNMKFMLNKYLNLILNNNIISLMGYPQEIFSGKTVGELCNELLPESINFDMEEWIHCNFNVVHYKIMKGSPVWVCDESGNLIISSGE